MILPGAQSLTEDLSRVGGFIAGCGQASALVLAHIANGTPISTDELTQTIQASINAGVGATVHGSTASASQWVLAQNNVQSQVTYNPSNLQQLINNALSQGKAVELGVNKGGALSNEPSGLQGHYITIVGENSPTSFIVADPNTPQSKTGQFVNDTLQQLRAANPFAAITATGAGPNTTSTTNASGGNPLDIAGAINNLGTNLGSNLISGLGTGLASATGLSSITDFGWRAGLTLIGIILVTIAFIFITFELLDKSNIQVAGTRV